MWFSLNTAKQQSQLDQLPLRDSKTTSVICTIQTPRYTQRGHQKYSLLPQKATLQLEFIADDSITILCAGICFFAEPFEAQLHANFTNGADHLSLR